VGNSHVDPAHAHSDTSDVTNEKKQAWKSIRKTVQFEISEIPDIARN
jgi:hypothetical protein